MEFHQQTVLITGASRGIGEAAARHFAALGANVVLLARSARRTQAIAAEIEAAGGSALAIGGDVARYEDLHGAVQAALQEFSGLHILVNNAGLIEPIARLADSDPAAWSQVVDVNLKGVYHALRAALPVMLESGGGTIVNISSGAATGALEGWSHYCATKAAVLSLTRCVHKEYAGHGIRCVGLSPGTVATDMQTAIRDSGVNPVSRLDPAVHIPADWVARGIAYLCTDAGAEFAGDDFSMKTPEGRRRLGLPDPLR